MKEPLTIKLGVMVSSLSCAPGSGELRLGEPQLCRALAIAAKTMPVDLYLFQLSDYDQQAATLTGYRYIFNNWEMQSVPLPDIIYDRSFVSQASATRDNRTILQKMHNQKPFKQLNARLPSKWTVYQILEENTALSPYLPTTILLTSTGQLIEQLNKHRDGLIIKPADGMQGKGIIHIKRQLDTDSYYVRGRTLRNEPFARNLPNTAALRRKLHTMIKSSRYIIQPYLSLANRHNHPFDIRLLLQKNIKGQWQTTGTAIRCGSPGGITSNLHGGGTAHSVSQFLADQYSKEEIEQLRRRIDSISLQAAEQLEQRLGKFAELAFDFGLDQKGQLWLLEVNSKPGRSCFEAIQDKAAQVLSIKQPLYYAQHLHSVSHHIFRVANQGHKQRNASISELRPFNVQEVHR